MSLIPTFECANYDTLDYIGNGVVLLGLGALFLSLLPVQQSGSFVGGGTSTYLSQLICRPDLSRSYSTDRWRPSRARWKRQTAISDCDTQVYALAMLLSALAAWTVNGQLGKPCLKQSSSSSVISSSSSNAIVLTQPTSPIVNIVRPVVPSIAISKVSITFVFTDITSNSALSGLTVILSPFGRNSRDRHGRQLLSQVTDENGEATFDDISKAKYNMLTEMEGFISMNGIMDMEKEEEEIKNITRYYAISPILEENLARFSLIWTYDVESIDFGAIKENCDCLVNFETYTCFTESYEGVITHDIDVDLGEGAEALTFSGNFSDEPDEQYVIYAHNWSGEGDLSSTGLVASYYNGEKSKTISLEKSDNSSTDQKFWIIGKYNPSSGEFTPINELKEENSGFCEVTDNYLREEEVEPGVTRIKTKKSRVKVAQQYPTENEKNAPK